MLFMGDEVATFADATWRKHSSCPAGIAYLQGKSRVVLVWKSDIGLTTAS